MLISAVLSGAALSGLAPAFAQTDGASRMSGLKLSGNLPIQIESDKLEVRQNDNIAIFTGNVNVVQGKTAMKAGKMTVHYANDGGSAATGSSNIERIEIDDKVFVKSETQTATGDRGTFDMKSEVLVLSGNEVVLSEGPNVLVGCKLTVQMGTGLAEVEGCKKGNQPGPGRVMMSLTPGSQNSN
ncbi:LPS ABC transporter substrate-binding protein LptA [Tianweitania sp. Rool2]|uniref:LPS ABC transporter substrate-binding protein LptA n=2 Tax=Oryzicola mucosus TaxID=2767425 RepID=A0A8J6PGU0_9HYPH|nr:LPS ABC transporter substrate-binding protein LptA [Oryzicola mucosus]